MKKILTINEHLSNYTPDDYVRDILSEFQAYCMSDVNSLKTGLYYLQTNKLFNDKRGELEDKLKHILFKNYKVSIKKLKNEKLLAKLIGVDLPKERLNSHHFVPNKSYKYDSVSAAYYLHKCLSLYKLKCEQAFRCQPVTKLKKFFKDYLKILDEIKKDIGIVNLANGNIAFPQRQSLTELRVIYTYKELLISFLDYIDSGGFNKNSFQ